MKRIACLALLVTLALAAAPAAAVTVNGRAGSDSWSITLGTGGQLVLTLYWNKRNALLFLRGTCDDGASFVSGSMQDRFQRVEIGVDPGTRCDVDVIARRSSSKYWLNIQGTGVFGARSPEVKLEKASRRGAQRPRASGEESATTRPKSH